MADYFMSFAQGRAQHCGLSTHQSQPYEVYMLLPTPTPVFS